MDLEERGMDPEARVDCLLGRGLSEVCLEERREELRDPRLDPRLRWRELRGDFRVSRVRLVARVSMRAMSAMRSGMSSSGSEGLGDCSCSRREWMLEQLRLDEAREKLPLKASTPPAAPSSIDRREPTQLDLASEMLEFPRTLR